MLAAQREERSTFRTVPVGRWVIDPQIRAGTLRAVRLTRKGVWCRWSALMVKDVAATPHVRFRRARRPRDVEARLRCGM